MSFVRLTGPVGLTKTAGPFQSAAPTTEEMTTEFTISNAYEMDMAFTGSPKHVLDAFCDEDELEDMSFNPVDLGPGHTSAWNVEVSGGIEKRLYEYACAISAEADDDPSYKQSPLTVLLHWARTGRYRHPASGGPAKVAEVLVKNVAHQNGCVEGFMDNKTEWDDIVEGYQEFDYVVDGV